MYERIKMKYLSSPILAEQTFVDSVLKLLDDNSTTRMRTDDSAPTNMRQQLAYNPDTKVGMIDINGPLTYKPTGFEAMCGGASYQSIEQDFLALAQAGAKIIITMCDTPGGEAYGCFEAAKRLRAIADEYGVKWVAYNDGVTASAGYALVCPADAIFTNPDARTGSIGIVVTLFNDSKKLAQEGVQRTYVYAGENKVPVDGEGNFRQEYLADLQMTVDTYYMKFVKHVSDHRPMSENEVRGTKAAVFLAEDALLNHLVDKKATRQEFAEYIGELSAQLAENVNLEEGERRMSYWDKLFGSNETNATIDESKATLEAFAKEAKLKVEGLEATLAETVASAAAWKQKYEAIQKEFKLAADSARKEKLTASFGDEKGSELFTKFSALDDTAFASVYDAMVSAQAAADAVIGQEAGVSGENESTDKPVISGTATLINQRYYKTNK